MEALAIGVLIGVALCKLGDEIRRARWNKMADKRIRERYQRGDV